jgi:hypothetical protein
MRYRADRASIASCHLLLNAHELRSNGCLRPGWSGKWVIGEGSDGSGGGDGKGEGKSAGKAKVSIRLRAKADRLYLRWDRQSDERLLRSRPCGRQTQHRACHTKPD